MRELVLSIVAPAHNESENVRPLVDQVGAVGQRVADTLSSAAPGVDPAFEFVLVDDGSTDDTQRIAIELAASRPWLRVITMRDTPPGRGNGQSAAFHAGFRSARGHYIAVLDADLQNDPADLIAMGQRLVAERADMVQGDRSANRKDNAIRKVGTAVGRAFRRLLLADTIRDTGCSLRLMRREIALALPLQFKGMHRFIPATARQLGFRVVEMPVTHRPRVAGETKYGMGITKRAIPGLIDCFAVRWMRARRRPVASEEATPNTGSLANPTQDSLADAVRSAAHERERIGT